MATYVGLDVSLRETSICIVDETGAAVKEGAVPSDPDRIADYLAELHRLDSWVSYGVQKGWG